MRKVKYRAWDHCKDRMFQATKIDITHFRVFDDDKYWTGNYELMQYTGLKDRNGVEIYEGDVLESRMGDRSAVTFELGAFRTNPVMPLWDRNCEVIGNIYESPELLKENQL